MIESGERRALGRLCSTLAAALGLALGGCGGGGGGGNGGSTPPVITGGVLGFPTGGVPPGAVPTGFNSAAVMTVQDGNTGYAISDATVTVNGTALRFVAAYKNYEAGINVAPGDLVTATVSVSGSTYTVSGTQFGTYPTITAPGSGATWSTQNNNVISWTGVAPPNAVYGTGVIDTAGNNVWPASGIQIVSPPTTDFVIPAGDLSAGSRLAIVGIATTKAIPGAGAASGFVLGGFTYVPITVTATPVLTLSSIIIAPDGASVSLGGTRQLTATGVYSDSSTADLTAQVSWSSAAPPTVTVSSSGLVTGVSYGRATVTASLGGVSRSATVRVFQPTPSASPPLSQAVAYQVDYAHTGFATFGTPLTLGASPTWTAPVGGPASYPLIVNGRVYVLSGGNLLYALDEATGAIVWQQPIPVTSISFAAHAYDGGKVFVLNDSGLLSSFDAVTGQPGWATQMPGQYAFSAPPTAVNGVVYVGGAGSGGSVYAVDESDGSVLWTASVMNGDDSSPAVSPDGVFVSYPCQTYKFDPYSGATLWHYNGPCEGGGGRTPAYFGGKLYMRDWGGSGNLLLDSSNGTVLGTFTAAPIPAFATVSTTQGSTPMGFFVATPNAGSPLNAIDLSNQSTRWSFTGDGLLVTAPIVVDNRVFVGSFSGNVYELDAATGALVATGNAGSAVSSDSDGSGSIPRAAMAAGEGYLIVPAGSTLVAWRLSP